jgi:hypothetical protein
MKNTIINVARIIARNDIIFTITKYILDVVIFFLMVLAAGLMTTEEMSGGVSLITPVIVIVILIFTFILRVKMSDYE